MHSKAPGAAFLVGVVIVNWNGWRDTLAAYESLKRSRHDNWILFVVDNGSTDGSVEHLRNLGEKLQLIESGENLGFAGGCNLGLQAAQEAGADYVYLLNNDAQVDEHTLSALIETSRELNDSVVLGSIIRFQERNILQFWGSSVSSRWGGPHWFPPSDELYHQAKDLIESDFIMGASLFAPRSIFERVGSLDDRYFLNFEETDWCYRARRLGYRCVVTKRALVLHKGGASIGSQDGPMQVYFMQRNRLLFCEKNVPPFKFIAVCAKQVVNLLGLLPRLIFDSRPTSTGWRMVAEAKFRATLDYALRRFGDCPPIIRKLAADFRALL